MRYSLRSLALVLALFAVSPAWFAQSQPDASTSPPPPVAVTAQPGAVPAAAAPAVAVVSTGTMAGEALAWVATVFGVPIGGLLTAWLYRMFSLAGVALTDAMRARLQEIVISGINLGASRAKEELAGRGQVEIKNAAVAHAVEYVQLHGADSLRAIGVSPSSNFAVDAIKARIETAIADVNSPTAAVLATAPKSA